MFLPPDFNETNAEILLKKIFIPHGMTEIKAGRDIFIQSGCPVNTCIITRDNPSDAALVLFKDYVTNLHRRPHNQVIC